MKFVQQDTLQDTLVVELRGRMDSRSAGQVYDTLVDLVRTGRPNLVVDLSGVTLLTRAGIRGLVVAAKLLATRGGALRICCASPAAIDLLNGLGYRHLLKLDKTRGESLAALAPPDAMAISIAEVLTAPVSLQVVSKDFGDTAGPAGPGGGGHRAWATSTRRAAS